jgi:CheY-like chemotaxis protein
MKKTNIILVDQERNTVAFLTALMADGGYRPLIVSSAEECLCRSRETPPDCIIINILSLVDEGISLYVDIKCDRCLDKVPVILLSPISRKTFDHYPKYEKARREKGVPEPDGFLEIPSETDEIIHLIQGLVPNPSKKSAHKPYPKR